MPIRPAIATAALFCLIESSMAGSIPQPGDFYFMSRSDTGEFRGGHRLYLEHVPGLRKVRYCQRDYYVHSHSVAWTQAESELGHIVQIEFNFGKGWRPICKKPQDQVTLADLGIDMSAQELLGIEYADAKPDNRLSAIGHGFASATGGRHQGSFHTR